MNTKGKISTEDDSKLSEVLKLVQPPKVDRTSKSTSEITKINLSSIHDLLDKEFYENENFRKYLKTYHDKHLKKLDSLEDAIKSINFEKFGKQFTKSFDKSFNKSVNKSFKDSFRTKTTPSGLGSSYLKNGGKSSGLGNLLTGKSFDLGGLFGKGISGNLMRGLLALQANPLILGGEAIVAGLVLTAIKKHKLDKAIEGIGATPSALRNASISKSILSSSPFGTNYSKELQLIRKNTSAISKTVPMKVYGRNDYSFLSTLTGTKSGNITDVTQPVTELSPAEIAEIEKIKKSKGTSWADSPESSDKYYKSTTKKASTSIKGSTDIERRIIKESIRQGVDPALALAIAKQESGIRHYTKSGSVVTGRNTNGTADYGVFQLNSRYYNPALTKDLDKNIQMGISVIKDRTRQSAFKGNLEAQILSYNRGVAGTKSLISKGMSPKDFAYVKGVMKYYKQYKPSDLDSYLESKEVSLTNPASELDNLNQTLSNPNSELDTYIKNAVNNTKEETSQTTEDSFMDKMKRIYNETRNVVNSYPILSNGIQRAINSNSDVYETMQKVRNVQPIINNVTNMSTGGGYSGSNLHIMTDFLERIVDGLII